MMGDLTGVAFVLGTGRPFEIHRQVFWGIGFYLVCALWGLIFGAAAGAVAFLLDRILGRGRLEALWSLMKRPIWLLPWRRAGAEADAVPRSRRRRWPWLVGAAAFLILATAFGAGAFVGRFVDRRLAAAIAEADSDDLGWRFDDVMGDRELPPQEENSAIVVAEVVSMIPEGWPPAAPANPGGPKPPPTEVEQALSRLAGLEPNVRMDDETADAMRAELAEHADAVELARTVAGYEQGGHVLELTNPNPLAIPLTETQGCRHVARLLVADAAIRAQDGDVDGALESCRAILGVGRSIGDEPMSVSKMVRIALGIVATDSARRALAQGEPTDEALAAFQADLLRESPRALLIEAVRGERAILDETIRRVRDGELPIKALSPDWAPGTVFPPVSVLGTLMFDHQRAVGLELTNELQAIARTPSPERRARMEAWQDGCYQIRKSRLSPFTAMLPLMLMPAAITAEAIVTRYEATLGASVILTAAERHRRKTGSWPESTAAIDRAFLAEEPLDPFSGEPFRIERRDGRFLVYSVGPNLKDEHGAFDPKKWPDGGQDDNGTGAWDPALRGRPAPE